MSFTAFQRALLNLVPQGSTILTYVFKDQDFAGGSNWTEVITGPLNMRGKVIDVSLYECTEVFAAGDADSRIDVGIIAGDLDAYALTPDIGELAAGASKNMLLAQGVIGTIPADNVAIQVTGVDGTTPTTGIVTVSISIAWFI